jgi:hypothetical protein
LQFTIASTPAHYPLSAPEHASAVRRQDNSTAQGDLSAAASSYWLEDMQRQGIAAFNQNPSTYKVFRNIKDYGAKGMRFAQGVIHTLLTGNLQVTE